MSRHNGRNTYLKDDRGSFAIFSKHSDFFLNLCVSSLGHAHKGREIKLGGTRALERVMRFFVIPPFSTSILIVKSYAL